MAYETLLTDLRDGVMTVTLNRPDKLNAFNTAMSRDLIGFFRDVNAMDEVRAIVVTGAGRAFCAGADISGGSGAFQVWNDGSKPQKRDARDSITLAIHNCLKPVIAAINGAAVGWGMELALYADLRVASDRAKFSEMFVKRGLVSDVGGFYRLPAIVGPEKAAELLMTGDVIDAAEALRIGLVGRVVPHDTLMDEARALAHRIAANPPLAVRAMKTGLTRFALGDARDIGSWAISTIYRLAQTEDHASPVCRIGAARTLHRRNLDSVTDPS